MKNRIILFLVAAMVLAVPASAQQLFDFLGQASVPATVGGTLSLDSVVRDPAPDTTPIPLDFANYEYTLVVSGLVLDSDGMTQVYSGGTLTIYADNTTAADFASAGSFSDGTAILVGTITTLNRTMFTSTLGTVSGNLDWYGGSRLDEIAPDDQQNWAFLSGINARAENVEPGYNEQWDGKVEPQGPIVDTENVSWGSLKAMF